MKSTMYATLKFLYMLPQSQLCWTHSTYTEEQKLRAVKYFSLHFVKYWSSGKI